MRLETIPIRARPVAMATRRDPFERNSFLLLAAVGVLCCVAQVIAMFKADMDPAVVAVLTTFMAASRALYAFRLNLKRQIAQVMYWLLLELGFFGWIVVADLDTLFFGRYSADAVQVSIELGCVCIVAHSLIVAFWPRPRRAQAASILDRWRFLSKASLSVMVVGFPLGAFGLSLLCNHFGYYMMGTGVEAVALPFKLGGLINLCREFLVPYVALFLWDACIEKREKSQSTFLLVGYCVWLGFESYWRLSRGVIILGIVPLLFWAFEAGRLKRWMIAIPIAGALGFAMFPVIGDLRSAVGLQGLTLAQAFSQRVALGSQEQGLSYMPIIRAFPNGYHVSKFVPFVGDPYFGNQFREVVDIGGPDLYHTVIIDQASTLSYSAGCAAVADGYLMGGWPLAICESILLTALTVVIDNRSLGALTRSRIGRAIMLYLLFGFVNGGIFANFFWVQRPVFVIGAIVAALVYFEGRKTIVREAAA